MISALRSVLDNNGNSGGGGAPKRPLRGRLLPILAVLGNVVLALLLAPVAHADDSPTLLTIQPYTASSLTVVMFTCVPEGESKSCPGMTIDRQSPPSPEWTFTLSMVEVCPTDDAAFMWTRGPVGIKWPESPVLVLETTSGCAINPWLYYHQDGESFVGLRFDPKTQRLSIEQSEVPYR